MQGFSSLEGLRAVCMWRKGRILEFRIGGDRGVGEGFQEGDDISLLLRGEVESAYSWWRRAGSSGRIAQGGREVRVADDARVVELHDLLQRDTKQAVTDLGHADIRPDRQVGR